MEFKYDYMSRRVQKKVSTWDADLNPNGGGWVEQSVTRFIYDGWNVVMVLNGSNEIIGKYTWGLDLSGTIRGAGGIGGLLAGEVYRTPNGGPAGGGNQPEWQKYWFFYDANGNVGQVLDATGTSSITIAAHYEYDPYGNVINNLSSYTYATANPIRFSTKWFDVDFETGLGYWGYRYYSPRLGRWVSRDLMEEKGGLSLYGYVANRPSMLIDAHGLFPPGVLPPFPCPEGTHWEPMIGCVSDEDGTDILCCSVSACQTAANNAYAVTVGLVCPAGCALAGPGYLVCLGSCHVSATATYGAAYAACNLCRLP